MGIPYVGNRDGDIGRDMTDQRWYSNMESMENGTSNVTELEVSESGVVPEV